MNPPLLGSFLYRHIHADRKMKVSFVRQAGKSHLEQTFGKGSPKVKT